MKRIFRIALRKLLFGQTEHAVCKLMSSGDYYDMSNEADARMVTFIVIDALIPERLPRS